MRGTLLLLFALVAHGGSVFGDNVESQADAMARAIESESKLVEAQSDAMVGAINAKARTVDSAEAEQKFERASQKTENVMDSAEQAVEDKASKAEEKQNRAEDKMEALSKKVERIANTDSSNSTTARDSRPVILGSEPVTRQAAERNTVKQDDKDAKNTIEPSKIVVLPDVAIKGTDPSNMQVKELQGKKSKGLWLAVHIPDKANVGRPLKIIATKNAANDLERVVGPNKETLFKELQTIIGVDADTLREMLKAGEIQNDKLKHRPVHHDDDDDSDDDEEKEDDDDDDNDDDDTKNSDDDKEGESDENDKKQGDADNEDKEDSGDQDNNCDDTENQDKDDDDDSKDDNKDDDKDEDADEDEDHPRKNKPRVSKIKDKNKVLMDVLKSAANKNCRPKNDKTVMLPWALNGSRAEPPKLAINEIPVSDINETTDAQSSGYTALEDFLNNKQTRLPDQDIQNPCTKITHPLMAKICNKVQQQKQKKHRYHRRHYHHHHHHRRRHHHHSRPEVPDYSYGHTKYYLHLKKLMEKYMDKTTNLKERQILNQINLLLSDQLRAAPDGMVHMYTDRTTPTKYAPGINNLLNKVAGGIGEESQGAPQADDSQLDDSAYNGHVIKIPHGGGTGSEVMSSSQANVLNSIIHTKLGEDTNNAGLNMKMLKEELGRTNSELEEAEKEKAEDAAIMKKYMYKTSRSSGGPFIKWSDMQKVAEEKVNGQQVTVLNQNQVNVKNNELPESNPDVPSMGGFVRGRLGSFYRSQGRTNDAKF
ncbi:MATH and LRR domain-containing protein PFE0570w isoform X3 [Nematostella vectensis]|uniref:MATH and LRR domain-containing protein PFE0570w isoform X3 n=1 Tax=Nematostella vectensis TaxID=45351 RepID=UPI00207769F6|nr:MATH and LRR domain-containing protein PFE0570w isoform X3 [Nematostella vectensis]